MKSVGYSALTGIPADSTAPDSALRGALLCLKIHNGKQKKKTKVKSKKKNITQHSSEGA